VPVLGQGRRTESDEANGQHKTPPVIKTRLPSILRLLSLHSLIGYAGAAALGYGANVHRKKQSLRNEQNCANRVVIVLPEACAGLQTRPLVERTLVPAAGRRPSMNTATWHGSAQEFWRLRKAISRNCSCQKPTTGPVAVQCAAHQMLTDQCVLDHLLYAYHARDEFRREEFGRES
jgi:hypothetical protein